MNRHITRTPAPWESAQVIHDQAVMLAASLRREAIDDFWRGAGARLNHWSGAAAQGASRAALRLGHSLARHFGTRRHLEG